MSQQSISEMIWKVINDIQQHQGEYDAVTLSQQLIVLSTLYVNLTEKIADFERLYQVRLGEILDLNPDTPFNKIELAGKRFEEYHQLKKAQALEKSVIQVIRSVNKYIKIRQNEMEASRFQNIQ